MLFSQANGRPIMSVGSATTLGNVSGFIVDARNAQILALRLSHSSSPDVVVHWDDVQSFGPDAVTVADDSAASPPQGRTQAQADNRFELLNKRVLGDDGNEAGTLTDIDFDPDSGRVLAVMTSTGRIGGERLRGCGSYAVMVRADNEQVP